MNTLSIAVWIATSLLTPADPQGPTRAPRFARGLSEDSRSFPIGVWLQAPRNAARYKELGVNLYVGLWKGPTAEQLDALDAADMPVICEQNEFALTQLERPTIVGWMHADEPDNAQALPDDKGWGPPIAPAKVVEHFQRMRSADPTRPVLLNLGQGVAWDGWHGRGSRSGHPEDYLEYVRGCDIACFDIYPVAHDKPAVAGKLEFVGRGVERLRGWCPPEQRVFACIETTQVGGAGRCATPAELRSEVWMALIHGARGIVYFVHEFKPKFVEAGLLANPEMARAVRELNAEVARFAPLLDAHDARDAVTVESSPRDVRIALLCRREAAGLMIFAVAMGAARTAATFEVRSADRAPKVEVLGEERRLELRNGRFADTFEGYAVHIYRIQR